jgi:cell division inhibitor SepF
MATMWRRAMHYLGLGPDDEYNDDQGYAYEEPEWGTAGSSAGGSGSVGRPSQPSGVSRVEARPASSRQASEHGVTVRPSAVPSSSSSVRPMNAGGASRDTGSRTSGSVRQVVPAPRLHTVVPAAFNDAQDVGDHFKAGDPVAMDLSGVDRELARRLIDFCSGLCYSMNGRMERVANQSYLIVPEGVEVSDDDRQGIADNDNGDGLPA